MKKLWIVFGLTAVLLMAAGCSKDNGNKDGGGQEENISFDDVKVDVGEYKGMEVEIVKIPDVTDEDVQIQMDSMLTSAAAETINANRVVGEGDLISLDYQLLEGDQPVGEVETNYYVTVGSGVFFDGAEEALIGKSGGDTAEIPVTLPESYPDASVAGKSVVLKVTVNGVVESGQAELTDEYVASISDCATVEEYKKELKDQMQETVEYQRHMAKKEAVWNKLLEQTKIEGLPEAAVEKKVEQYQAYDKEGADLESMSLEDYVKAYFDMSIEDYEKQIKDIAMEDIKTELIVKTIAQKEGFADDEISDEELKSYAAEQGYDDVETFKKEVDTEELKESILLEKVTELLVSSAKVSEVEN